MGIGIHRQANITVTHELLSRGWQDAVSGQERGEGVAQAVNVHGAALDVSLGDPGGRKVQIERPQEALPDVEQPRLRRDVAARGLGQVGNVLPQVIRQVRPEGQRGGPTALGMLAFDLNVWVVLVKADGIDGQRSHLTAPQAGEYHELVNERPLLAETFESPPLAVANLGQRLALVLAGVNGEGFA